MKWRAWWDAIREIAGKPPSEPKRKNHDYHQPKPTDQFIPPHSHPDPHPKWPDKKDRS